MTDGLSTLYQDLLGGSYDCVDRIVLNAYFRMGHDPGGFRVWWRALTGSDEMLENAYLMRLAGRFRLSGRAAQARPCRRIPGQDEGHPGLVSGPGRSGAGAGVGIHESQQRARRAAVFEPGVLRAVDLYQFTQAIAPPARLMRRGETMPTIPP